MPVVNVVIESEISRTTRCRQLESMFDVPSKATQRLEWRFEAPFEREPWNVGLIVGPSGSGKSTVARALFEAEYERPLTWDAASVIDDFDEALSIADISRVCQSVGFNTVPAWLRPFAVLSTGEKFRVEVARRLIESSESETVVVDEFTSVIDRQVAQFGSHAIQKLIRRANRKFVAVSCHYDVIDWLQPDWIIEPGTGSYRRRRLRRRPAIEVEIQCVHHKAWRMFAPFHYMTAGLNKAARCFILYANGVPASFTAVLYRPHARVRNIYGFSRTVTLPDFQGLGLAFVLKDRIASIYKRAGRRIRSYPAHPAYVRSLARSAVWSMRKKPGTYAGRGSAQSRAKKFKHGRPCGVFEYVGPACADAGDVALLSD